MSGTPHSTPEYPVLSRVLRASSTPRARSRCKESAQHAVVRRCLALTRARARAGRCDSSLHEARPAQGTVAPPQAGGLSLGRRRHEVVSARAGELESIAADLVKCGAIARAVAIVESTPLPHRVLHDGVKGEHASPPRRDFSMQPRLGRSGSACARRTAADRRLLGAARLPSIRGTAPSVWNRMACLLGDEVPACFPLEARFFRLPAPTHGQAVAVSPSARADSARTCRRWCFTYGGSCTDAHLNPINAKRN